MKQFPEGTLKRVYIDQKAVEANLPRVRRHEPVFVVEVEEGDTFVKHSASRVDIDGPVETMYGFASGFVRFTTRSAVTLDADPNDAPAPTKTTKKAK